MVKFLENIYISPLELCNLSCLYCYTKKPKTILSNQQILDFVKNYQQILTDSKNNFFRNFNAKHLTGEKNSFATANRFELYINGIEIANGCEENRDYTSILQSFEAEQQYRLQNNLPTHPISTEFVKISSTLPLCSGIGVGIERLLKIININGTRQ